MISYSSLVLCCCVIRQNLNKMTIKFMRRHAPAGVGRQGNTDKVKSACLKVPEVLREYAYQI